MIHLEYDVPTAGVRVSFVVYDEAFACPAPFVGVSNVGDQKHIPQTRKNLTVVSALLEAAIETQS
jgi:hypothetical protein